MTITKELKLNKEEIKQIIEHHELEKNSEIYAHLNSNEIIEIGFVDSQLGKTELEALTIQEATEQEWSFINEL